jgi:hypothetical protein
MVYVEFCIRRLALVAARAGEVSLAQVESMLPRDRTSVADFAHVLAALLEAGVRIAELPHLAGEGTQPCLGRRPIVVIPPGEERRGA